MQESGDFRLLRDETVKKGILKLVRQYRLIEVLQQNFLQAMDAEYIPLLMSHFDLVDQRITDVTLLDDQTFVNFFAYTLQDTGTRVYMLRAAREQATLLLDAIGIFLEEN